MLYIMSDPILILTSYMLEEWNRQFYYRCFDQLIHILLQAFLLYEMSGKQSAFTKSMNEFTTLPHSEKKN